MRSNTIHAATVLLAAAALANSAYVPPPKLKRKTKAEKKAEKRARTAGVKGDKNG